MNESMDKNSEEYLKAQEKVKELKQFYKHALSVALTNIIVLAVNLIATPNKMWFYWVTLGTGIGLISHGYKVFVKSENIGLFGPEWEQKKIQEMLAKK